ncbi:helix-turn-helix domain-containing protein [Salipiger sp. P9]|uniref:helix-turn-helix domain-containing protein n=1 Tax=Salipiger pentaromativorans TaxID=2943193 RepID=UPI0021581A2A|nr:helix-turn-helix domain-containing protein [Salipiger pentaromativorans]MCR8549638.1 helix-turn-helix domain-containing protein [Salipiger pentaromativorans]
MHGASLTRLSLLGHPLRARVFGLLVRRLPHGMTAGALAQALAVAPSTLSAHLSALSAAGLLEPERRGAARLYRAAPDRLGEALGMAGESLCLGRAGWAPALQTRPLRLTFLCDDNAALSLIAEALSRRRLAGRALVGSAGLAPAAVPDPLALALLTARGHDPGPLIPKAPLAEAAGGILIALTPRAADALPVCGRPALCAYWPLEPPPPSGPLIPRAIALHAAYRALNTRLFALRRLPLNRLPRVALQAALDDLSSGLPAAGHVCGSRPEPLRTAPCPAPRASAAS